MTDLLSRLNSAIDGLCPCGAPPRDGTAYCGDDCRPTHIGTDTGGSAMRWRPDLVTAAPDDPDLEFVDSAGGYSGPFNATVYQRSTTDVWRLRLDDGHRWVGCDLDAQGATGEALLQMMASVWRRLERELADPRHTVPGDPFRDVAREWAAQERTRRRMAALEPIRVWLRSNSIDPNEVPQYSPIEGFAAAVRPALEQPGRAVQQAAAASTPPPQHPMLRAIEQRRRTVNSGPEQLRRAPRDLSPRGHR